ncbi:MAG TPA: DinB family protein [Abditibacterium sp.]|jgi:uncharacterized damage-inducible protein DinB
MHPLQLLSDTVVWAGKNLSYNLNSIPDDKLSFKPAPEAKSALEISSEVVHVLQMFTAILQNQKPAETPVSFATRDEAKAALETASAAYGLLLLSLGDNDLIGEMQLPFGAMPKAQAIALPVVETIHHHGQIAYIQTILGDTESHFFEMGT